MSGPPPDYIDVAERIRTFSEKHPDGCLRPADPGEPYRIETVAGATFIVVVAAAHRTPDDPTPGIGMAWEPFPGPTNFTRDSELQNAETSAWGRAIVAVLAADTKRGVASANEVRNRPKPSLTDRVAAVLTRHDIPPAALTAYLGAEHGVERFAELSGSAQDAVVEGLEKGILVDRLRELVPAEAGGS